MIEAVTTSPLFGIVLCIGTFQIGRWVQKKTGLTLANPLVIGGDFTVLAWSSLFCCASACCLYSTFLTRISPLAAIS